MIFLFRPRQFHLVVKLTTSTGRTGMSLVMQRYRGLVKVNVDELGFF